MRAGALGCGDERRPPALAAAVAGGAAARRSRGGARGRGNAGQSTRAGLCAGDRSLLRECRDVTACRARPRLRGSDGEAACQLSRRRRGRGVLRAVAARRCGGLAGGYDVGAAEARGGAARRGRREASAASGRRPLLHPRVRLPRARRARAPRRAHLRGDRAVRRRTRCTCRRTSSRGSACGTTRSPRTSRRRRPRADTPIQPGCAARGTEELHALDYLVYAYLQGGQDRRAAAVLDRIRSVERAEPPSLVAAYALAAAPARYALERHDWRGAAALVLPAANIAWESYRWSESNVHFAVALGAARSGNLARARQEVAKLDSMYQELRGKDKYAGLIDAQRRAAAAWIAQAEGRPAEASGLLRSAADIEESIEKHPVTPGVVLPARELLGDLLLEQKRPAEALAAYEAALKRSPRRFNSVAGAMRAAERSGCARGGTAIRARAARAECERGHGAAGDSGSEAPGGGWRKARFNCSDPLKLFDNRTRGGPKDRCCESRVARWSSVPNAHQRVERR